jgi:hypothetical protein
MNEFERLGAFYLGRVFDPQARQAKDELLLYDSKDLTTHAVCLGMTGSGKTGLCLALLEEAGIDGIPAIAIDPKGDLANLFLTFPELRPGDFRPWIDEGEATRSGMSAEQYAAQVAKTWTQGLSQWGQDGERIRRFRDACELALYTPGMSGGRPLRVLRSLAAPASELAADPRCPARSRPGHRLRAAGVAGHGGGPGAQPRAYPAHPAHRPRLARRARL